MSRRPEGLYIFTRHSTDCKYHSEHGETDRTENRRCNCMKYIAGTAPDGTRMRESTGTTSWERARKALLHRFAKHDPTNKPLFELANRAAAEELEKEKTVADAVADYMQSKYGTNHAYETIKQEVTLLERQLLQWCKEQGLLHLSALDLDQVTRFRNGWGNNGATSNRKASRLRSFFRYCERRHWITENPAEHLEPSLERSLPTNAFRPDEFAKILDATYVSHEWRGGRDFHQRGDRIRALLLFMRWTGLAIIDCVRFPREHLQENAHGIWTVQLRRTKNDRHVYVAVPDEVATAVLAVPQMSEGYFFWTGNGEPQTACKGWRRTLMKVFQSAKLKRENKLLRCHMHMLRDTFAVEKLQAGATLEEVSLLLGHSSVKITERHYLPWDSRRQDRLTRAAMVDFEQALAPGRPSQGKVIRMSAANAAGSRHA